MGNDLQVFRFKSQTIDILLKEDVNFEFDGDFLIHGKQTAQNLGYVNDRDAINSHTDVDERIIVKNSDVVKTRLPKIK
ncbi:anti-repressor [Clostridium botulinum A1 str. CFSAN002368]|nr:anti-repressor [Clostridium botulinum A1 str. CFSAN002368]